MLRCAVASGLVIAGLVGTGCTPLLKVPAPPERNLSLDLPMTIMEVGNKSQILLLPDPAADLVSLRIRYNVGAVDDPVGQEGVAHLAEHLMFEMRLGNDRLADLIERATVYVNAATTLDNTDYITKFERDKLPDVLHLEAMRIALRCNTLSDQDFERERAVVVAEIKQHQNVGGSLYQQLMTTVFPVGHSYGRNIGGTPASLSAITKTQACQFINDHYAPNNAIVAISGPVDAATLKGAITEYARLPARNLVPQVEIVRTPTPGKNATLRANIDSPGMVLVWSLPRELEEHTLSMAVGRMVVQRINNAISDFGGSAFATELGGDKNNFFIVWIDGNGAPIERVIGYAQKAVNDHAGFYGQYGFENASAHELTSQLRDYDDVDERIERALFNHERGITAPAALQRQLKALDALSKEFAEKTSATQFAWEDAQQIALLPDASKSTKVSNKDIATIANIHAQPPVDQGEAQVAMTPLALPARQNRLGAIKERALSNGLTVITAPNAKVPVIDISLVLSTGAALEPAKQRGIAQLSVDALSMRNTDYQSLLLYYRAGGSRQGAVLDDITLYHVSGAAAYLDILLRGMERWAISGSYDPADVRDAVASYKRSLTDEEKAEQAGTSARYAALYGKDHPYTQSNLSSYYKFDKLTADNAVGYARRTVVPNKATLIVTGNFDEAAVERWIAYVFHDWHGTGTTTALPPRQPTGGAFAANNQASQVSVFLAYPSTSTTATSRAARLLIGAMLDEASGAVRNELAASYGVSGKYSYDAAGGTYIVRGLVDAARVGEALTLLRTRIAALGDGSDLAKRTFAVARRKAALAASGDPTSSADLASVLVGATEMGLSPQQAGELPAEIAKLTYPDIVPYLAAELVPSQEVISLAGPKAAVTAAFVALKITPIWR